MRANDNTQSKTYKKNITTKTKRKKWNKYICNARATFTCPSNLCYINRTLTFTILFKPLLC